MISDREFLEIIQGLYEKTAKENLKWERISPIPHLTSVPPEEVPEAYQVRLPKSVIELQYRSPRTLPEFIDFSIARDVGGPALAMRKVYEGDQGWEPLSELYALVQRRVLGWDDVFKSVRDFLGNPTLPAAPQPRP